MKPRRRWFQYSLRSFLILLTALAVWLGVVVNRAREQREAVKAIEALNGRVVYEKRVYTPTWIQKYVGNDLLQDVVLVTFLSDENHVLVRPRYTNAELEDLIPMLQQLQSLRFLFLRWPVSKDTEQKVKSALPRCKVRVTYIEI